MTERARMTPAQSLRAQSTARSDFCSFELEGRIFIGGDGYGAWSRWQHYDDSPMHATSMSMPCIWNTVD
eukprot:scaffold1840_cov137-Skeletonema_dohrnii-CCMP3373.AAC.7